MHKFSTAIVLAVTVATGCTLALPMAAAAAETPAPHAAGATTPAAGFERRLPDLIPVLNGKRDIATLFSARVIAKMSPDRMAATLESVMDRFGEAQAIEQVQMLDAYRGNVTILCKKGRIRVEYGVEEKEPNLVSTLLITRLPNG